MGRYNCWGDDHEDLTEQVRMKVLANGLGTMREGIDVMRLADAGHAGGQSGRWRVTGVTCSRGHDNSFEGTGTP